MFLGLCSLELRQVEPFIIGPDDKKLICQIALFKFFCHIIETNWGISKQGSLIVTPFCMLQSPSWLTNCSIESFAIVNSINKSHFLVCQQGFGCFITKNITFRAIVFSLVCVSYEVARIWREKVIRFTIRTCVVNFSGRRESIKWIIFMKSVTIWIYLSRCTWDMHVSCNNQ